MMYGKKASGKMMSKASKMKKSMGKSMEKPMTKTMAKTASGKMMSKASKMKKSMAKTAAQPKPAAKTPVKKYTAKDSVSYERMMDRQFADSKIISKGSPKQSYDAIVRSSNRQDSMVANPYYKQNYEAAITNFKKKVKK